MAPSSITLEHSGWLYDSALEAAVLAPPRLTTQSRIASAARTARSGSSSCATGGAEHSHDSVADELLHRATEPLQLHAELRMVIRQ